MFENKIIIFDFDSTFIKVETIDELAKIILKNDKDKTDKLKLIEKITNLAMNGEINFSTALKKRLEILSIKRDDIKEIINVLSTLISDSIKRNKNFIKSFSNQIWIVSGGFKEIIVPIVSDYGIEEERILANEFVYHNNTVIGCEESKLLFQNKGKIKAIERQNLEGIKIIIGDGYTDYEVFQNGAVQHFVYYCENINRSKISHLAEYKANSFEELIDIIKFL